MPSRPHSLSLSLTHFPYFAGQISYSSTEPQILCNNNGVRLVQASADVSLTELDFSSLNRTIRNLLVLPLALDNFPLNVQVTSHTCGCFSIIWAFDHLLADGAGFIKFLSAWCEIAITKKLTTIFDHDRQRLFPARSPPFYSQLVDKTFTVCSEDELLRAARATSSCFSATQWHLYLVKGSTLKTLRAAAGSNRTRTEALSAYLWKLMAKTMGDDKNSTRSKMGFLVDGRPRMSSTRVNYVGNVVSMAVGEEIIKNLKEESMEYVARIISETIGEVANSDHFSELVDWIECHRPAKMAASIMLGNGDGEPAIIVSACHNMPVMAMDFGFGLPSLGMFVTTMERFGSGFVSYVSTGREDGSWFVSAFIWPELAAAIESDPARVFHPLTAADHLCK